MNVHTKFEVRSFTPSWDSRGGLKQKNLAVPGYAHAPFSLNFWMVFCSVRSCEIIGQIKSVALPVPETIAIEVLRVANPQSWGRGGLRGSAVVPFERALVSSYRPSIVTFPVSLRVRATSIAASVLQHATFPTPPLFVPKFPHFPLRVCGWLLGYEERMCWANRSCIWFPRFPTYVVLIHQRHRRTDDMQSQIPRFAVQCMARW